VKGRCRSRRYGKSRLDGAALPALLALAMASPYVLSLAHALVLKRITDHPDADAVSVSAALRWPVVVVEQLLADLERQGMIAPPTRH